MVKIQNRKTFSFTLGLFLLELQSPNWVLVAGGVIGLLFKMYIDFRSLKLVNKQLEKEINTFKHGFEASLFQLNEVKRIVDEVFIRTSADRFLILHAVNGTQKFNFVSCIYEQHKNTVHVNLSLGSTKKYRKYPIDNFYRQILKDAEIDGFQYLITEKLPPCSLKDIYETEKVSHSFVFFLSRNHLTENDDSLIFCSVAKHPEKKFAVADHIFIKQSIEELKTILKNI